MNYANRGLLFENMIERTLDVYEARGQGLIKKVATPWQVERDRSGNIHNAYPLKKSTVDYIGIYHNKPVAFEAKSTKITTRFPLSNIEPHQIEFLKTWREHGGIAFLLIHFSELYETFLMPYETFEDLTTDLDRKSLPYDLIASTCPEIVSENGALVDFAPTLLKEGLL